MRWWAPRSRAAVLLPAASARLQAHAGIQVNLGKTRAWNAGGMLAGWATCPCHPTSKGWVSLGPFLAATRSHKAFLAEKRASQDALLQRIPAVPHLQSAWLILLLCGAPRANYLLRILPPCRTLAFVLRCLERLLSVEEPFELDALQRRRAQLPLARGGMGLRFAERRRSAAYWASWVGSFARRGRTARAQRACRCRSR